MVARFRPQTKFISLLLCRYVAVHFAKNNSQDCFLYAKCLLRHVSISIFIAAPRWHIAFRKRKSFSLPIYYNVKTLSCQLFFCNSQKQFFIAVLRYTRGQKCKLRVLSRTGEYVRFAYARYPLFIQFTQDLNCINTLIIINYYAKYACA